MESAEISTRAGGPRSAWPSLECRGWRSVERASLVCEEAREDARPDGPTRSGCGATPRLGDRAREAMRLRRFSPRTEGARLHWMRRYHHFHGRRDPAALGEEHVTAFPSDLASRRRGAASTHNQALAATHFLCREVLGREIASFDRLVRARRPGTPKRVTCHTFRHTFATHLLEGGYDFRAL